MINFDRIQPNIFIGSAPSSKIDVDRLKLLKITALISLQSDDDLKARSTNWLEMQQAYRDNDISAHRYSIRDFDEADLGSKAGEPILILNTLLKSDQVVYVHCNAGICRAPAVVLGYFCYYKGMSIDQGLEKIRNARPIASPYKSAVKKAILSLTDDAVSQC